jgi:hypothetical protein
VSTGFGHLALLTFSEISTLGTDLRSARVTALRRFASVYARRVEGEGGGVISGACRPCSRFLPTCLLLLRRRWSATACSQERRGLRRLVGRCGRSCIRGSVRWSFRWRGMGRLRGSGRVAFAIGRSRGALRTGGRGGGTGGLARISLFSVRARAGRMQAEIVLAAVTCPESGHSIPHALVFGQPFRSASPLLARPPRF